MRIDLWELVSLSGARPFGPVALVALAASVLASLALVVSALVARRRGATRATRVFAFLTLGTFTLGAFAASRVLAAAHEALLLPQPPSSFGKVAWVWGHSVEKIHVSWLGVGVTLVIVAAASGAALALLAKRAGALRPFVIAGGLACLLALVTGVGIVFHLDASFVDLGLFCGTVENRNACMLDAQGEGRDVSSIARVVIVALATLGSGLLVVLSRRSAKEEEAARDPEAMLPLGAALFAFGLAAWIGARGMAHDARRPLPLPSVDDGYCPDWMVPPAASLPPAGPCNADVDAPMVTIHADGPRIDGARAVDTEELKKILQNKRELFRQLQQRDPVDPVVVVMAPADTPIATIVPVVAAAQEGFRGTVAIMGAHPARSVSTATLGEVTLERRCCNTRLRMGPSGAPLSSHATWGDVARAASEGAFFRLDP